MLDHDHEGRSGAAIASYLSAVNFPCPRNRLISEAEDNFAPEVLLDRLERLQDRLYESVADVMAALRAA